MAWFLRKDEVNFGLTEIMATTAIHPQVGFNFGRVDNDIKNEKRIDKGVEQEKRPDESVFVFHHQKT